MLPEGVHLDQTKAILDNISLDNVNVSVDKNTPSEPSSSSVLKLRGSAGIICIFSGIFFSFDPGCLNEICLLGMAM